MKQRFPQSRQSRFTALRPQRRRRDGAAWVGLLAGLLLLPAAASLASDPIQQVDQACTEIDVPAEVDGWQKITADVQGQWQATGSVGADTLSQDGSEMWFAGNALVEEIRRGDAVAYRSLTGVSGDKTVSLWTSGDGGCRRLEGSLTGGGNSATRSMGDVQIQYERFQRPSGCVKGGGLCTEDSECCSGECDDDECTYED